MLSPSELARLTGVSTDTLRHYERKGVLGIPARSQGGYRLYPPEAVGRVDSCGAPWRSASRFTIWRPSCRSATVAARLSQRPRVGGRAARRARNAPSRPHRVARRAAGPAPRVGPSSRPDPRRSQARLSMCSLTDLSSTAPSPVSIAPFATPTRVADSNAANEPGASSACSSPRLSHRPLHLPTRPRSVTGGNNIAPTPAAAARTTAPHSDALTPAT